MKKKQRRCRLCGALFEPNGAGDAYCSELCRTSGMFVGGGGDTSKPVSPERKKALEKAGKAQSGLARKPRRFKADAANRFPRVTAMQSIPKADRWRIAKDFTEEEREYARSLAARELAEERRFLEVASWDGAGDEPSFGEGPEDEIGESDDGTV